MGSAGESFVGIDLPDIKIQRIGVGEPANGSGQVEGGVLASAAMSLEIDQDRPVTPAGPPTSPGGDGDGQGREQDVVDPGVERRGDGAEQGPGEGDGQLPAEMGRVADGVAGRVEDGVGQQGRTAVETMFPVGQFAQ